MDKAYEQALDAIADSINKTTGIAHHDDQLKVIQLFDWLLGAGRRVDHSDQVGDYLRDKHGLKHGDARDIQLVYEILESKSRSAGWPEMFSRTFRDELLKNG